MTDIFGIEFPLAAPALVSRWITFMPLHIVLAHCLTCVCAYMCVSDEFGFGHTLRGLLGEEPERASPDTRGTHPERALGDGASGGASRRTARS